MIFMRGLQGMPLAYSKNLFLYDGFAFIDIKDDFDNKNEQSKIITIDQKIQRSRLWFRNSIFHPGNLNKSV